MIRIINIDECKLVALNKDILKYICTWKYEEPYNVYDLELNQYLKDSSSWGREQFVLAENKHIMAYVACQMINKEMWVGWSLRPDLCGQGIGREFANKCINELIELNKHHNKDIFLKVGNWNTRAIKTYEKLGFVHHDKLTRLENNNLIEYIIMKIQKGDMY